MLCLINSIKFCVLNWLSKLIRIKWKKFGIIFYLLIIYRNLNIIEIDPSWLYYYQTWYWISKILILQEKLLLDVNIGICNQNKIKLEFIIRISQRVKKILEIFQY